MQKGIALLWTLLLSVVLLIITGTMVTYIIKESRASVRTENSAKAYSAAKSGIEWALKISAKKPFSSFIDACPQEKTLNLGDAGVSTKICRIGVKTLRSSGYANGAIRTIEHVSEDYDFQFPEQINHNQVLLQTSGQDAELVMDLYTPFANKQWSIGLKSGVVAPYNSVYLVNELTGGGSSFDLKLRASNDGDVSSVASPALNRNWLGSTSPTRKRLRIKMINGTRFILRMEDAFNNSCVQQLAWDKPGAPISGLNRIHGLSPDTGTQLTWDASKAEASIPNPTFPFWSPAVVTSFQYNFD